MSDTQVWKDVVGYEGLYQVSSEGNVRVLPRTIVDTGKGGTKRVRHHDMKQLALSLNRQGYYTISLTKDKKQRCKMRMSPLGRHPFCSFRGNSAVKRL